MITKALTGTYVSGYLLQSPITALDITATAYIEGAGVTTPAGATQSYSILNAGRVVDTGAGSAGINLTHGGTVTNGSAGYIFGRYGVSMQNAPGRVANYGSIIGSGAAVYLAAGGKVTNGAANDTGALLEGGDGVEVFNSAATLANFGRVVGTGASGRGVVLGQGGDLTNGAANDTGALISSVIAVEADNAPSRITNFGTINATFAAIFSWGGSVTNGSAIDTSAQIQGALGVEMSHTASTLTNFGRIIASGGYQGAYLQATGRITNGSEADTGALIESLAGTGVRTNNQSATIQNFGTIKGGAGYSYAAGVSESPGGALNLTNGSAGDGQSLIEGYNGVILLGAGVVTNYGVIEGNVGGSGRGSCVLFASTSSAGDHLVAEAGSQFEGVALVNQGSVDVVSGTASFNGGLITSGTIFGAGTLSLSGGATQFDVGANLTVAQVAVTGSATMVEIQGDLAYAGAWTQTAGTLSVANAAQVNFSGVGDSFSGTFGGAGAVGFAGGSDTLNGADLAAARMSISGASVTLEGTIANSGTMSINTQDLLIGVGGAALDGGTWALSDSATNRVMGLAASATLDNASATISGAGLLGGGQMNLINRSHATIDGNGQNALIIDTGANQIATSGLIEATGSGGVMIQSAVLNAGMLEAAGGTLTVDGAVRGPGTGLIAGGALVFNSTFAENVTFTGTNGVLALANSQTYTGAITGLSTSGATSLDLVDIGFVSFGEATFSGTAASGVLTVTDGTHTAHVTLIGDYLGATFVAGGDGHTGTVVKLEPGAIHWLNPVSGDFSNASDWSGGAVPGAADVAVLDASGSTPYTVTASATTTVGAIQTAANATLAVSVGVFTAAAGSGFGANVGTISVADGGTFSASGTVDNVGVLALQGVSLAGPHPYLSIGSAGLTLTGGGEVVLADALSAPFQPCPPSYSLDRVTGVTGATLTNVDNTIAGAGWIGLGDIGLVNETKGVIDASLVTDLILDPVGTLVNKGLLESTGPGGLYILRATVDNSSGGVIAAAGDEVYVSFSDIIGGTLTSSGSGYIYCDHGADTLDGATAGPVTNKAYVFVSNDSSITLDGAIDNLDEFEVGTDVQASSLIVGVGGASLTGGGQVALGSTNPLTGITAAAPGATLFNVDNTISGQGQIGAGGLVLINEVGGVIEDTSSLTLTLDTGSNVITNAGLIETTRAGGMTIKSAVANSGTLEAAAGTLTVSGAVSGSGMAEIANSALVFTSTFAENLTFSGPRGVLALAKSQSYTGAITGFSKTGGTSLDLADIGFVSAAEATFSGTATSGVLTVTDGVHTARITLIGDYRASAFTASSDGHGGVVVVDPAAAHRFIAAAASLGAATPGSTVLADSAHPSRPPMLARPGVAIA